MDFIQILPIIIGVIALAVGIGAGKFLFAVNTKKQVEEAEQQVQKILSDAKSQAETLKKERLLEAKEKFVQLKAEHDREVLDRNRKINDSENRIKQKEQSINTKLESLDKQGKENDTIKDHLNRQIEVINQKRTELEKHQEEHIRRLEKIAGLTADEAKSQLVESLKQEAQTQALSLQQEIIEDAKQKANKEARKIIIQSIQRTAAEQTIENTVTVFNLESDEIKGQIIGREGRNIRAIEAATGVDLIVDDTPEAIVLSSFDPLRREIARLSLQRLVADGRIHPARIEEVVEKTRRQIEEQVNAIGAHHDEMEMQYVISPIIQACDAISGARPGARREIMQQYIQRIKDLENLALTYQGVEKAYAIQAGRELRVIVEADKVSDNDSEKISFEMAQKIQNEMTYPGQIKVTVIREKRTVNVAR